MRTSKLLYVLVILAVSAACTLAPGNDPAAGDLEIVGGEFDASRTAPVIVTVTTPSAGEGQLFLSIVPAIDVTLPQRQWDLNFEAGVPQTIATTIQIDEPIPVGGSFSLMGGFMDVKSYVHKDSVVIYIWPDGPSTKRPDESFPTPAPLEIREVTPPPSP